MIMVAITERTRWRTKLTLHLQEPVTVDESHKKLYFLVLLEGSQLKSNAVWYFFERSHKVCRPRQEPHTL